MIHSTRQKAKFRSLVRRLRVSLGAIPLDAETVAVGILERLWHTAAQDAFRGDIGRLTNEEIAECLGWYGDADFIVEILVETRWLDKDDQYRLIVHDWAEHCPNYVKANAMKYGGFVGGGSSREAPIGSSSEEAPMGGSHPNLTKPNLTKPNLTAAASLSPAAVEEVLGLAEGEEVVRQANKLRKAAPSVEREIVWRIAWVANCFDRGMVGDLITRISSGDVRNPRKYLLRAIEGACDDRGYKWRELSAKVPEPRPDKPMESLEVS